VNHQVDEKTGYNPMIDPGIQRVMLRRKVEELAKEIKESTPPSREQSLALTKLQEAEMWANAANEKHEV
jgi:hypothetical protein